jgi:hypothetical protein
MTILMFRALCMGALLASPALPALAQQQDPTPRKGLEPWDTAQVQQIQAKRWLGTRTRQSEQETLVNSNSTAAGARTCVTNVGTTTQAPGAAGYIPRYGPSPANSRQNRVVVVTGSIINVCK